MPPDRDTVDTSSAIDQQVVSRRNGAANAGQSARGGTGHVGRFGRRARNYGKTIAWVFRQHIRDRKGTFVAALVLAGLFPAAQGAAVFVIYWFAQQMASDGGLSVAALGIDWRARTDTPLLLATIAACTACFVAAAAFNLGARWLLLNLVERNFAATAVTILRTLPRLPDPRARIASRIASERRSVGLIATAASGGRAFLAMALALPRFVAGIAAGATLVWVDARLTGLMAILAVLGTVLLYPVALRLVAARSGYERARIRLGQAARQLRMTVNDSEKAEAAGHEVAVAFAGSLRVRSEIAFVAAMGVTLVTAFAIYNLGQEFLSGRTDWPLLLVYLGALQITLTGWFGGFQAVALFGRHYKQLSMYRMFSADLLGLARRALGTTTKGETVILGRLPNGAVADVAAGGRVAVASVDDADVVVLALIAAHNASGEALRVSWTLAEPEAAIVLVEAESLGETVPPDNAVLLSVYRSAENIGAFGETCLIVIDRAQIVHFAVLGSPEAEAALDDFERITARKRKARTNDANEDEDSADD